MCKKTFFCWTLLLCSVVWIFIESFWLHTCHFSYFWRVFVRTFDWFMCEKSLQILHETGLLIFSISVKIKSPVVICFFGDWLCMEVKFSNVEIYDYFMQQFSGLELCDWNFKMFYANFTSPNSNKSSDGFKNTLPSITTVFKTNSWGFKRDFCQNLLKNYYSKWLFIIQ